MNRCYFISVAEKKRKGCVLCYLPFSLCVYGGGGVVVVVVVCAVV